MPSSSQTRERGLSRTNRLGVGQSIKVSKETPVAAENRLILPCARSAMQNRRLLKKCSRDGE